MLKLLRNFSAIKSSKTSRCFSDSKCTKCGFYSRNVEEKINEQIAMEFRAAYAYLSMQCHFARADVALGGCEKFFKLCAGEEKDHAMKLCKFQNYRGGTINLMTIENPPKICYTISDAFVAAVQMEKKLTEKLIEVKNTAQKCDDDVTVDFIVTEFLRDQVRQTKFLEIFEISTNFQLKAIQTLNGLVTRLNLLKDNDIGVHLFDKELQERLKDTQTFLR